MPNPGARGTARPATDDPHPAMARLLLHRYDRMAATPVTTTAELATA
ncbi:hypothetical protein [Streptomyces chartreusis]